MADTAPPLRAPVWEMQPTETPRAFAGFAVYRDLGPGRSLAKAAAAMPNGPGVRVLKSWSPTYRWVERARAFDASADRHRLAARAEATAEAEANVIDDLERYRRGQLSIALQLRDAALIMVAQVLQRLQSMGTEEIPVASLPSFIRAAVSVAEASTAAEAQAIGLTELLGILDGEFPGLGFRPDES